MGASESGVNVHRRADLDAGCPANANTGRPGLSGEQTLRLLIVRQLTGWTNAELAFHLADSLTYRAFCRVSALVAAPSKSALAATLRRVSAATLAALNDALDQSGRARRGAGTNRTYGCDCGASGHSSPDGFQSPAR